jgi:uncharacterized protein (TIGR00369 family)
VEACRAVDTFAAVRDLESLRSWFNGQDVATRDALHCDLLERGMARVAMSPDPRFAAPNGAMNGGHLSFLAENAAGLAVMTTREADVWAGAIQMDLQFLQPVVAWPAVATARVVRSGSRLSFGEWEIVDADGAACVRGSIIHSLTTSAGWRCG